jgi:adenine-specific DNA-methyltransferase
MMTMSSKHEIKEPLIPQPRYGQTSAQKSAGATYTPPLFAAFVADQMVRIASLPSRGVIRVLDPAVGDGALLDALIHRLPVAVRKRVEIFGYDTDSHAIKVASERLHGDFPTLKFHLQEKDFLDHVLDLQGGRDLFHDDKPQPPFDLVIANPPYVRTQIMGARQAQKLAHDFGLTGRVDLYYPFLLGISKVLVEGGTAGVITSNRFMTTRSGQAVRRELLSRFKLLHAWDMGDTKLFDAAVLPAVLLAHGTARSEEPRSKQIRFSSIYETRDPARIEASDALMALTADDDAVVGVPDGRRFRVRHGDLDNGGNADGIWRIATHLSDQWLATVQARTWATFRRIGKIRVGVKSTADKVFIRHDWNQLPGGRPELLRPLITRHCARQFKADEPATTKEILYPHEMIDGRRQVVDLALHPKAARYLTQHRDVLEARNYVIAAGRRWYELWVPQNPAAWSSPKLVFPDISEKPVFWMDTDGGVVNGECYWLQCANEREDDLLWLALAVANSSFIEAFYDHRFNNKLYAGRRRFITQYVEQFPLPDPARKESKAIVKLAKAIHAGLPSPKADRLIRELDAYIWQVFGLALEEVSG